MLEAAAATVAATTVAAVAELPDCETLLLGSAKTILDARRDRHIDHFQYCNPQGGHRRPHQPKCPESYSPPPPLHLQRLLVLLIFVPLVNLA
jgi:hypothetical protein